MIRPPLRHRLEWDVLESRLCPSGSASYSVVPIERTDAYAEARYAADLQQVASGQEGVVFLGDSITDWFSSGAGASVWQSRLASIGAADFGTAGDTAENLLWRIENGELSGDPKVAVVEIGTNDLGFGESVDQTVAAIEAVVEEIHALSPSTEVLLMGLFPRGSSAFDPLRIEVDEVNADLAAWSAETGTPFLDIDAEMIAADGSISNDFFPDNLHPNANGYEVWADAVEGIILEMLAISSVLYGEAPVTGSLSSIPTSSSSATTSDSGSTATASTNSDVQSTQPAQDETTTTPETTSTPSPSSTDDVAADPAPTSSIAGADDSGETAVEVPQVVAPEAVALRPIAQGTTGDAEDPFADRDASDDIDWA